MARAAGLALFVLGVSGSQAAEISWRNAVSGSWAVPTNWIPARVPGPSDVAVLGGAGGYAVTVSGDVVLGGLRVGGAGGTRTLNLTGGTFALNGPGAVEAGGELRLAGAGLTGSGVLTVHGRWEWSSGTVEGGGGSIVIGSSGRCDITGPVTKHFSGGTVRNQGTLRWTEGAILSANAVATVLNEAGATAEFRNSTAWIGGQGRFDNAGTWLRTGPGTGRYAARWTQRAGGRLRVGEGTAVWSGGGSGVGTVEVTGGAWNEFQAGTFDLTGATLTGAGTHEVSGGRLRLAGSSRLQATGTMAVNGGTLELVSGAAHEVGRLELGGGALEGRDTLLSSGESRWTSGDLGGAATWINGGGLLIEGPVTKYFSGGRLRNRGTLKWTEGAILSANAAATLINEAGATAEFRNATAWIGGLGRIDNAGTWLRTGPGTGRYSAQWTQRVGAVLRVGEGTAVWSGGGSGAGIVEVAGGAWNDFQAGTFDLTGVTLTGAGTHEVSGGRVRLSGTSRLQAAGTMAVNGGTLELVSGAAHEVGRLELGGGTLEGTDSLLSSGESRWTSGALGGAATWINGGGLAIEGPVTKYFTGGRLRNRGTLKWTEGAILSANAVATLVNEAGATAEFRNATAWIGGLGRIDNAGTWLRAGPGIGRYSAQWTQRVGGVLRVGEGTAVWSGGGSGVGTVEVSAGAWNEFQAGTFDLTGVALTGAGTHEVSGGQVRLSGTSRLQATGTMAVNGGTLELVSGAAHEVGRLELGGGALEGFDTLLSSGESRWTSGELGGAATWINVGGLAIEGPVTKYFSGGTLRNRGTLGWTEGAILSANAVATLVNEAGATAEFRGALSWVGGQGRIENAGVLRKTGGTSSMTLGGGLANSGGFEVAGGSVRVSGVFTQSAGRTQLANADLVVGNAVARLEGGTLLGVGRVESLEFSQGTLAPGDGVAENAAGILRFSPELAFGTDAVVEIDLGGAMPGTGHDQIVVEAAAGAAPLGPVVLAGTLRARLVGGYLPPVGTAWTVLRSRQRTGTFATTELPPGFVVEYTASDVLLRRATATDTNTAPSPLAETIETLVLLNPDGYLLDADGADADPSTQRDLVQARATVRFAAQELVARTAVYRMEFRLLDSRGRAVPLRGDGGVAVDTVFRDRSETLPRTPLGFDRITTERADFDAGLRPARALDPAESYRVEVRLHWRPTGGTVFIPTGDTAETAGRRILHFTNTRSAGAEFNAITEVRSVRFLRTHVVESVPGRRSFRVEVPIRVHRYDGFEDPVVVTGLDVELSGVLREVGTGVRIPMTAASTRVVVPVPSHVPGSPATPASVDRTVLLDLEPVAGAAIDILNGRYVAEIAVAHRDSAEPFTVPRAGVPAESSPQALLRFDGRLFFGPVETRFTSIANDPAPRGITAGSHVLTDLAVDANSGRAQATGDVRYGDARSLAVRLYPDGRAEVVSGSVPALAAQPDMAEVQGIRFRRGAVVLDPSGSTAEVTLLLPSGLGYRTNARSRRLMSEIAFGRVAVGVGLAPVEVLTATLAADLAEETKPLWFPVRSVRWQVAGGGLEFEPAGTPVDVRAGEFAALAAYSDQGLLVHPAMKGKRSNDGYFRAVNGVVSPRIEVYADAQGGAAMDVVLSLGVGGTDTHVPHGVALAWAGGLLEIKRDRVVPANSGLVQVEAFTVGYSADCGDCGAGGQPVETLTVSPVDGGLGFTPDGGLVGAGTLSVPHDLAWGRMPGAARAFAHRAQGFTTARFRMAGTFLGGGDRPAAGGDPAQTLLLSGVLPSDPARFERPGTAAYSEGAADYPGLNFRVGTDGAHRAEDVLGGRSTGSWDLAGRSKYVVRASGVTGIHEAVRGSFRAPPQLLGYEASLPHYGLSFRANQPVDSRIEGRVRLPEASDLELRFGRLAVTCLGDPTTAELPEDEAGRLKHLRYWLADIVPQGLEFRRRAADLCQPGQGVLVLAVEAYASHVGTPLQGELGFLPSGEIVSTADVRSGAARLDGGFDSGLVLPAAFTLAGPADEVYALTPAGRAYFTDYGSRPPDQQGEEPGAIRGYLSFGARMRLPFFREMPVHIHDTARREDPDSALWLMGDTQVSSWSAATDPAHAGYPPNLATAQYHDARNAAGVSVRAHRPQAHRRWLDLLNFDFPLEWSPTARSFRSVAEPQTAEWLFVLQTERRCRYLSARHVDLTFGATAEAIPVFTFGQLAFELGDQEYGLARSLVDAGFRDQAQDIREGLAALEELANPYPVLLFRPALRNGVGPELDRFVRELAAARSDAVDDAAWVQSRDALVRAYFSDAGSRLAEVLREDVAQAQPAGFGSRMADAARACRSLRYLIARAAADDPARPATRDFLRGLLNRLDPVLARIVSNLAGEAFGRMVDEHLAPQGPALDELVRRLGELEQRFTGLESGAAQNGLMRQEILDLFAGHSADLARVAGTVGDGVNRWLARFPRTADPLEGSLGSGLRNDLTRMVEDAFMAQPLVPAIHTAIRLRVSEPHETLRETFDTTGAILGDAVRSVASAGLRELDASFQEMLGDLVGIAAMGSVTGHAHFVGDSLSALRVDGRMLLQLGLRLEFDGFVEMLALESDTPSDLCSAQGESAIEVRFGATGSLTTFGRAPDPSRPGEDMDTADSNTVSLWGKAAFRTDSERDPNRPLHFLGFSGGLRLSGSIGTGGNFGAGDLAAGIGVSSEAFYVTGMASATLLGYHGEAGFFFGKICSAQALYWDPDIQRIMTVVPIHGAYGFIQVRIPTLVNLDCLLRLSAGVSMGAGFVLEGEALNPAFVGKFGVLIRGEALCILTIEGEIALAFRVGPDGLAWNGRGRFEVSLLFIDIEVTATLTYANGEFTGEID